MEPEKAGTMQDLIDALTILRKYGNPERPTHCEHDELQINGIDPNGVSPEDKVELDRLGFHIGDDGHGCPCFASFKFGSA
jgi:hypothetical protein